MDAISKKVCELHAGAGQKSGDEEKSANTAKPQHKAGREARMERDCSESAKESATNVREKKQRK